MKTRILMVAGIFAVLTSLGLAAEVVPAAPGGGITAAAIVQWLTPVIVPIILMGVKKIGPSIPGFVIPILAPLLGVAIDYINHYATGHKLSLLVAAALGLAGVGLREVKDQIPALKAPNGGWPVPNP